MKLYKYYIYADFSLFRSDFHCMAARNKVEAYKKAKEWIIKHPHSEATIFTLDKFKKFVILNNINLSNRIYKD